MRAPSFSQKPLLRRLGFLALLACVLLAGAACRATVFLQFDSAFLGSGWFQYKLTLLNDPFFIQANLSQLYLYFTNQIDEKVSSSLWTNSADNSISQWNATQTDTPRPYEVDFLVQSSETGYRLQTTNAAYGAPGALVVLGVSFTDFNPMYGSGGTTSLGGYATLSALVPCAADQSDGSPANYSYTLRLVPDVTIKQLLETNGLAYGVDFLWNYDSTFLLQGSDDLTNWQNIANIWSVWPETIWTTNQPLNDFGKFFRLQFVAGGYQTNLPSPQVKTALSATSIVPRLLECHLAHGQIAVHVATLPQQNVTVTALDSHNVIRAAQSSLATSNSATVYFDPKTLPTPVFFKVTP